MPKYQPDESFEWISNLDIDKLMELADKYKEHIAKRVMKGESVVNETFEMFLEDYFQSNVYPQQGAYHDDEYDRLRDQQIDEVVLK